MREKILSIVICAGLLFSLISAAGVAYRIYKIEAIRAGVAVEWR